MDPQLQWTRTLTCVPALSVLCRGHRAPALAAISWQARTLPRSASRMPPQGEKELARTRSVVSHRRAIPVPCAGCHRHADAVCVHGEYEMGTYETGYRDLNRKSNDGCEYACMLSNREGWGRSVERQKPSPAMGKTTPCARSFPLLPTPVAGSWWRLPLAPHLGSHSRSSAD
jgi:hypothetical protein